MDYEFQLDHLLEDLSNKHFPEQEPEPVEKVFVTEEVVIREEPSVVPVNKLDIALQKRRELKEQTNKTYERPTLDLGKKVINYDEVVEALGLKKKKSKVDVTQLPPTGYDELEVPEQELQMEEVVTPHQPEPQVSFVDLLSQQLSDHVNKESKLRKEENLYEQRFDVLEHQLRDLRRVILENTSATHNALFSPGGGETRAFYMDDVNNQTLVPGSYMRWDGTQFVGSVTTSNNDEILENMGTQYQQIWNKLISIDERFESIPNADGGFVKLEDNTITDGEPIPGQNWPSFFDEVPDGDTTRFIVSVDPQRGVFALEGIPQPTVELPRGDILEFDISQLDDPGDFGIYKNGVELEFGVERDDVIGLVTVRTGQIPDSVTKFYYKSRTKKGMGWVVNISEDI